MMPARAISFWKRPRHGWHVYGRRRYNEVRVDCPTGIEPYKALEHRSRTRHAEYLMARMMNVSLVSYV
jgi:hypothetical protein